MAATQVLLTEDDREITITRAEYDRLISHDYPLNWMSVVWPKLVKRWFVGGVTVSGCTGSGLATRVNFVRSLAS